MHDRPTFRLLHGEGEGIRSIARRRGASRNAVRRALAPGARDRYFRESASSAAEPAVRDLLAHYPAMSVPDIAVVIDWRHARRTLSDLVQRLRPEYVDAGTMNIRRMTELQAGTVTATRIPQSGTMKVGSVDL